MKLIKPVLWTVLGVVIGATAVLTTSRLEAQTGAPLDRAVCVELNNLPNPAQWINLQLGTGRSHFIQAGAKLCAW